MDVREKLVELLERTLPYGSGTLYTIADDLIAHFVTVRDVYDCEHCRSASHTDNPFTVITQMGREVKTQFNFCPNCGRRLPQPQKGE